MEQSKQPGVERRELSAVMFADMVEYTGLVQDDEPKARKLRSRYRELLTDCLNKHNGTIIQYYGDGALCTFRSTVEALLAAKELQQTVAGNEEFNLKVGVHTGDILYDEEGGIFGDGVNIASRIESLGIAGSVLFSERVYEDIKNHGHFTPVFLGNFELKHVEHSVKIFALAKEGLVLPRYDQLATTRSPFFNSIAVLPFLNLSTDPDTEYFGNGIADEIIGALSGIKELKVTSRTSSFAFKNSNEDISSIAEKLGVSSILEGSVKSYGNQIRISARLVDAVSGYQVWSETYQRELDDMFSIQEEIARAIAKKLRTNLEAGNDKRSTAPTQNVEVYNQYLRGKYHWNIKSVDQIRKAIEIFEDCVEQDPQFSLAYSSLASCYVFLGAYGQLPPQTVYPKARKAALRALELEKRSAEAHIALALVEMFYELNWNKAGIYFHKALELNPGSAEVHHTYSWFLSAIGNHQEAINEIKLARQLDPLSLSINTYLAEAYLYAGRYEEAMDQYENVLGMDSGYKRAQQFKGWLHWEKGEDDKALTLWKDVYNQTPGKNKGITALGVGYALIGQQDKAEEVIKILKNRQQEETSVSVSEDLAIINLLLGKMDQALDYSEEAFEQRFGIFSMVVNPLWTEHHDHPRIRKLLDQIKRDQVQQVTKGHAPELDQEIVTIQSDLNEELTLNLDNLIYVEAQGNYSKVVWIEDGQVKSKLLRIVIKKLQNQLISPFIIRCHRSYLINLKMNYSVSGNSRGYKLKSQYLDKKIPVSRSKGKKIVPQLD